ncbi:hypothetical protein JCM8547_003322 [Rhodosporidiobolus lusitaniae]
MSSSSPSPLSPVLSSSNVGDKDTKMKEKKEKKRRRPSPPDHISLTFLGTAAGKPCQTRNVSSLVVKMDSRLWMFDAGEGTQHQLVDPRCKLQMGKIQKIFVTHMHADHINGLPGLLCTISAGEGSAMPGTEDPRLAEAASLPPTQIYGPSGLRLFLRTSLSLSHSVLSRPYTVHELLWPDEAACPQGSLGMHESERRGRDVRMGREGDWREVVGEEEGEGDGVKLVASPVEHTIRCIAYLLLESPRSLPLVPSLYLPALKSPLNVSSLAQQGVKNPLTLLARLQTDQEPIELADGTVLRPPGLDPRGGKRICIVGDTYDASGMLPLIHSSSFSTATELPEYAAKGLFPPPPSSSPVTDNPNARTWATNETDYLDLLIHESTNAFLPQFDSSQAPPPPPSSSSSSSSKPKPTPTLASITSLARSHGHSTPQVAGSFARLARARRVVLNHLSNKYPDPESSRLERLPEEESKEGRGEREKRERWRGMLKAIEGQAEEALLKGVEGGGEKEGEDKEEGEWRVKTARDFMEIVVERRDKIAGRGGGGGGANEGKGKEEKEKKGGKKQ